MNKNKIYVYGSLLALPFILLAFYALNPSQCPAEYTQAQVDASGCVVGANIGGMPIFIAVSTLIWLAAVWLVRRVVSGKH